jgi:hypothetical protein
MVSLMAKKLTYDKVFHAFSEKDLILLEDAYINSKTKMAFKCIKHPDERQYMHYNSLINKRGCRYCGIESRSNKRRLSYEDVKKSFENKGYVLLEDTYLNNRQKLKYICPNHPDKDNYITYSDFQQGVGCAYCAGLKKNTFEEVKKIFEDNNFTLLDIEYINTESPLKCHCNVHSNIIQYKSLHLFKQGHKCAYCMGKIATYETSLGFNYPEIRDEWDYEKNKKLTPYDILPKSNKFVWWKCSDCGNQWNARIADRTGKNSGCPACVETKGEKKIRKYLESRELSFSPQYEFNNLKGIRGGNLSFDFYLESHNLLIEYQGEFHDGHGSTGYTKNNLERQQEHDKRKREYAEQNGIDLLEIWHWDYKNIESILDVKLVV